MTQVCFKNIKFARNGKTLFQAEHFEWPVAGITAILGPNGAGKSLFLALCHGHLTPDKGSVTWAGITAQDSRRNRGFMFQRPNLMRRSVEGHLKFALRASGTPKSEWKDALDKALQKSRLEKRRQLPAAALSGGEAQRLAFARATITNPDVVLLDEPGGALDPAATMALENLVLGANGAGKSILIATHDLGQAKRLADRVIFISNGMICETGEAAEFFDAPKTREGFNYLNGILE